MYQSLNAQSAKGADQFSLETYQGVSYLGGVSVSILIILWSETDQSVICMSICVTMYKKGIQMLSSMKAMF